MSFYMLMVSQSSMSWPSALNNADVLSALVTAQIAKEIEVSGKEIEKLYGVLSEDVLKLQ